MKPAFAWYFHLPPCSSHFEVDELVENNLALLLDAHMDASVPVGIAITGGLLSMLRARHQSCLAALTRAMNDGIVDLIGTACFDACLPLLTPDWLVRQIDADMVIKQQLFGVRPSCFWPSNLAWTPALGQILADHGFEACLIDEAHFRESRETQLWRWVSNGGLQMETLLVNAHEALPSSIALRLALGTGGSVRLYVPSAQLRLALSFSTSGAIHHAWDDAPLDSLLASRPGFGPFSSIDDGDRINAVSIHQYRRLLAHLSSESGAAAANEPTCFETVEFLPAWLPGGQAFWRDTTSNVYLMQLDALYRLFERKGVAAADVLPLQDVFPLFWKRVARARWFHDRLQALLLKGSA